MLHDHKEDYGPIILVTKLYERLTRIGKALSDVIPSAPSLPAFATFLVRQ